MEETTAAYGTTREIEVTVYDANDNFKKFRIPNAKEGLTSDSAVVTAFYNELLRTPETSDDFQVVTVEGQPVTKATIAVIETTKTHIIGEF